MKVVGIVLHLCAHVASVGESVKDGLSEGWVVRRREGLEGQHEQQLDVVVEGDSLGDVLLDRENEEHGADGAGRLDLVVTVGGDPLEKVLDAARDILVPRCERRGGAEVVDEMPEGQLREEEGLLVEEGGVSMLIGILHPRALRLLSS